MLNFVNIFFRCAIYIFFSPNTYIFSLKFQKKSKFARLAIIKQIKSYEKASVNL